MIATSIEKRLIEDVRRTPAAIPTGMPISSQRAAPPNASATVTGSRRAISSRTGMKLP